MDRALLATLAGVVDEATAAFEAFNYTRRAGGRGVVLLVVLRRLRGAGEVAGLRRSDAAAESAQATLAIALSVQLRLFAPVLPFVTEEVWSWWQDGSVHRAAWPVASELPAGGDPAIVTAAAEALAGVRKAKSDAKVSMRADVADGDDHRARGAGGADRGGARRPGRLRPDRVARRPARHRSADGQRGPRSYPRGLTADRS